MKITFVGHVCVDKNLIRGELETFHGGGVVHGAVTAKRLGAEVSVLTKCAEADREHFTSFRDAGVDATFLPSRSSTSIRNEYPTENPDDRRSFLIARADPFASTDIASLRADVVHLNPLWLGELPFGLLPQLKRSATVLGADAQGFLRHADADGAMFYRDLAEKRDVLPLLDVFKVDTREALILTGLEDVRPAAKAVHDLGPGFWCSPTEAACVSTTGASSTRAPSRDSRSRDAPDAATPAPRRSWSECSGRGCVKPPLSRRRSPPRRCSIAAPIVAEPVRGKIGAA